MSARKLPKESSRIQGIQESPESPGKRSLKASGRWMSESPWSYSRFKKGQPHERA